MKVKVISLVYIFQVLYVLCFTRSRYQVSVYRTNGPLVCSLLRLFDITSFYIQNFKRSLSRLYTSVAEQAVLSSLVGNSKNRFSHDMVYKMVCGLMFLVMRSFS